MSTHNICLCGEIRKIFSGYPPLSGPMNLVVNMKELQSISFDCLLFIPLRCSLCFCLFFFSLSVISYYTPARFKKDWCPGFHLLPGL